MRTSPWTAVFALAASQHGAVARRQIAGCGIDDAVFTRRVRSERWAQPHRGVYLLPGTRATDETRLSAALLAVGDHAAVSGVSALALYGLVAHTVRPILVVPHGRRASASRSIRVIRSRTLADTDLTSVDGLRCTIPPRAFLDAAPSIVRGDGLRPLLISARQRGVSDPADVIDRALSVVPRVPGRNRLLRAACDVAAVGADSPLTDVVHRRLLADGFTPDPDPVAVDVGDRLLHPDITFSAARVCIECDSLAYHGDQRSIDLDHRKDQAYASVWWRCLRVGWRRHDLDWSGFTAVLDRALTEWPAVWRDRVA